MMMDEGQERVRASYRDNYDRLAQIKGRYDPENLFSRQPEHPPPGAPESADPPRLTQRDRHVTAT